MEALYDYTAQKSDELSFSAGEVMEILRDKSVWLGILHLYYPYTMPNKRTLYWIVYTMLYYIYKGLNAYLAMLSAHIYRNLHPIALSYDISMQQHDNMHK